MMDEAQLREKLRKIEALFAGAATPGEKAAAGAAAERIRQQIGETARHEGIAEFKFSLPDPWSRQLFIALCRRYGVRPFRYSRMRQQTVVIKAPRSIVENMLWPAFQQANAALSVFLADVTSKVIREEVCRESGEADEVPEPLKIGR
jgi:hypothetical protein